VTDNIRERAYICTVSAAEYILTGVVLNLLFTTTTKYRNFTTAGLKIGNGAEEKLRKPRVAKQHP